ncbi:MAG: porin family protein [Flavobacterium sp.]
MRIYFYFLFLFSGLHVFAQDASLGLQKPKTQIDSLYREDQFYFGITYNTLAATPEGYSKDKIAAGFTGGFLRDMPVNKNRTIAVAAGLGMTYNGYNHNFGISGTNANPTYTILGSGTYTKNKLSTFTADLPIELRWRTSTFESTQFWRIYAGFKLSYLLSDRNVSDTNSGTIIIKNNSDFNKLGYSVYLSAGYNTFNFYLNYGLNSMFQKGEIGTEKVKLQNVNLGLIFYIL